MEGGGKYEADILYRQRGAQAWLAGLTAQRHVDFPVLSSAETVRLGQPIGGLPAGGATNHIIRIFNSWIMAASISLLTVFSSVWTISVLPGLSLY